MAKSKSFPKRELDLTAFINQIELIERTLLKSGDLKSVNNQYSNLNNSVRFQGQQNQNHHPVDFSQQGHGDSLQQLHQYGRKVLQQLQKQPQQNHNHNHNHQHQHQHQQYGYKQVDDYYFKQNNIQKLLLQNHHHHQQQLQQGHKMQPQQQQYQNSNLVNSYVDMNNFSSTSLLLSENSPHMSGYDYKNMFQMVGNSSNPSLNSPSTSQHPQNMIPFQQNSANGFFGTDRSGSPVVQNLQAFSVALNKASSNSPPSILLALSSTVPNYGGSFLSSPSLLPTSSIGEGQWSSTQVGQTANPSGVSGSGSIWGSASSYQRDLIGSLGQNNNSTTSGNYNSRMW